MNEFNFVFYAALFSLNATALLLFIFVLTSYEWWAPLASCTGLVLSTYGLVRSVDEADNGE